MRSRIPKDPGCRQVRQAATHRGCQKNTETLLAGPGEGHGVIGDLLPLTGRLLRCLGQESVANRGLSGYVTRILRIVTQLLAQLTNIDVEVVSL